MDTVGDNSLALLAWACLNLWSHALVTSPTQNGTANPVFHFHPGKLAWVELRTEQSATYICCVDVTQNEID
jgi:hypothetical protein